MAETLRTRRNWWRSDSISISEPRQNEPKNPRQCGRQGPRRHGHDLYLARFLAVCDRWV